MFLCVEFRAVNRSRTSHTRMECGGLLAPRGGEWPPLQRLHTRRARSDIRQHSV